MPINSEYGSGPSQPATTAAASGSPSQPSASEHSVTPSWTGQKLVESVLQRVPRALRQVGESICSTLVARSTPVRTLQPQRRRWPGSAWPRRRSGAAKGLASASEHSTSAEPVSRRLLLFGQRVRLAKNLLEPGPAPLRNILGVSRSHSLFESGHQGRAAPPCSLASRLDSLNLTFNRLWLQECS